ncbi:MAG: MATE family efflux transporter [Eubacteriales bacterium]|nr:MATE family efflux transporter [Eubacteriales bacterium]
MNEKDGSQSRREFLGREPIGQLMLKFAIPSIIAMLVSAVYNIVDQIFIGRAIGTLGNAATNIAFPLSMSCTAIGLLFGIGGAANFNINMGKREYDKAPFFIGNAVSMMCILGCLLTLVSEVFLAPMLRLFGSPSDVLPYAMEYVRVTAIGFPFLILTIGGGHLMRADGSPNMTMFCSLSGAIINIFLDALFVFGFHLGMFGAALATVIGQVFSGIIVIFYVRGFKTVKLLPEHFIPTPALALQTASLGVASCANQLAMMLVQIILNNSLKHYGALSAYGEAIPIACAGIVMKVNQIFFSIVIGIAQGSQPIESFNYGAKQYNRVMDTYMLAIKAAAVVSLAAFAMFQLFPRTILQLFGNGTDEYFTFGVRFFRIFLFCTWANCIQPATSQFFASVGKPLKGMFISLTRQIIYLLPIMLILPIFIGIDGILFAGPVADMLAAVTAALMVRSEFKDMHKLEKN